MSRAAIFFDRDGTICREVGYVNHPSRLELMPGAGKALSRARTMGFALVLATNQAGAARGYFPPHTVALAHRRLREMLARDGAALDGVYACLHHPQTGGPGLRARCSCRKPAPGLLLRAAQEHGLDLARSFMVGDSFKDVGAGRAAGVRGTVLLRTGYGRGELLMNAGSDAPWPDYIADDLDGALDWIEERARRDA